MQIYLHIDDFIAFNAILTVVKKEKEKPNKKQNTKNQIKNAEVKHLCQVASPGGRRLST